MGLRSTVVTTATVLGLAVGVNQALLPQTSQQINDLQHQQNVKQGSDANEREHERLRDRLPGELDGENFTQLTPGEYDDVPRLRFRILP